jgi:hypothetical protein
MDTNAITYSDYLMVIRPPEGVVAVIKKYKKATANVIGNYNGMDNEPHILLTRQYRQMPSSMKQKLDCKKRILSGIKPVTLFVNGFNYVKHSDVTATIYAKIETNNEVSRWFAGIKKIFHDQQKSPLTHIPIAENIPLKKFEAVWPKFTGKRYSESFTPQGITILSKPMIGGKEMPWCLFGELYFKNFD